MRWDQKESLTPFPNLAIIYQVKKREEIVALGLDEVIPKRRCPRARAVMITTDEVLNRREEGGTESKFLEAERQPTEAETRLMFSLALRELIMVCMRTHMYSIGTDGKLQSDGGPIGLKLWCSWQSIHDKLVQKVQREDEES